MRLRTDPIKQRLYPLIHRFGAFLDMDVVLYLPLAVVFLSLAIGEARPSLPIAAGVTSLVLHLLYDVLLYISAINQSRMLTLIASTLGLAEFVVALFGSGYLLWYDDVWIRSNFNASVVPIGFVLHSHQVVPCHNVERKRTYSATRNVPLPSSSIAFANVPVASSGSSRTSIHLKCSTSHSSRRESSSLGCSSA